jgi:hypothetical protein
MTYEYTLYLLTDKTTGALQGYHAGKYRQTPNKIIQISD